MSVPEPRRRLRIVPNETPCTRLRGTRGNVSRPPLTGAPALGGSGLPEEGILLGARPRRELEAARAELLDRRRPPGRAGPRDEAGSEDDAVHEDRDEEALDVLRHDVPAPVEQRPRTGSPLEGEAPPDRAP